MNKYSGLDPEDQVWTGSFKGQFCNQKWPDMAKKLQKLDEWNEKPIEELLREVQKVFVKREEERDKQKEKIMVTTVEKVIEKRGGGPPQTRQVNQKGQNKSEMGLQVGDKKCFKCRKPGHFKRECPLWEKEEDVTSLRALDEEQGRQGFPLIKSYQEPVIKVKVGTKEDIYIYICFQQIQGQPVLP